MFSIQDNKALAYLAILVLLGFIFLGVLLGSRELFNPQTALVAEQAAATQNAITAYAAEAQARATAAPINSTTAYQEALAAAQVAEVNATQTMAAGQSQHELTQLNATETQIAVQQLAGQVKVYATTTAIAQAAQASATQNDLTEQGGRIGLVLFIALGVIGVGGAVGLTVLGLSIQYRKLALMRNLLFPPTQTNELIPVSQPPTARGRTYQALPRQGRRSGER